MTDNIVSLPLVQGDDSGSNRLAVLAAEIQRAHSAAVAATHTSVERSRDAGRRLIEAKALAPNRGWLAWLKSIGINERTARYYMQLARLNDAKAATVADLGLRPALEAIRDENRDDDDPPSEAEWTEDEPSAAGDARGLGPGRALRDKLYVILDDWREMPVADRSATLSRIGKGHLNKQDNSDIEWADWSWNPVTGCLHGCPYCYARDIAAEIYPAEVGFGATIWPDRLTAPANQKPPQSDRVAARNIFTCSMADLFGRWVPKEWIEKVLSVAAANPQWNFLFLTKFPKRMAEFDIPANAWMGTTVDVQARVANAERAFEKVRAPIRWLSIEPMIEPLKFSKLDLFDWVVIGGASPSRSIDGTPSTPAWNPPIEWLIDLHQQAQAAGCKIYYKTNSGLSDMTRIREFPGQESVSAAAPDVFNYLRNIPQKEQVG